MCSSDLQSILAFCNEATLISAETMLNGPKCAVYNNSRCSALTGIYWNNGTDDIQLWKKNMPMCKDLEPCVPCQYGGGVIILLDQVCHKIDMEGCGVRIDYQRTGTVWILKRVLMQYMQCIIL